MERSTIIAVIDAGFKVYMRDERDTWMIYTDNDDTRLAYLECDDRRGATISTKHKPHKTIGSGFALSTPEKLDRDSLLHGFIVAPHWATASDAALVKKYASMKEYIAADNFNSKYKRVLA